MTNVKISLIVPLYNIHKRTHFWCFTKYIKMQKLFFNSHEGRTWKTQHRGRLWIAAASKEPEDDEILACEEFYRDYYGGK